MLPELAGPGATVFLLAVSRKAGQGWSLTEEVLRADFAEPHWAGTQVEEIDVVADVDGQHLLLPGYLLRTVRASQLTDFTTLSDLIRHSVHDQEFQRAVLSGTAHGAQNPWRRVVIRKVALRDAVQTQVTWHTDKTAETRNYSGAEAVAGEHNRDAPARLGVLSPRSAEAAAGRRPCPRPGDLARDGILAEQMFSVRPRLAELLEHRLPADLFTRS